MIANSSVNVMDYIPAGTDTATTDCTSYIQAAIDSLAATGGTLIFPDAELAIGNKIVFAGGIHYKGSAGGSSKLIKHPSFNTNNPDGDVMVVSKDWDTAAGYDGASYGVISDLAFDEGSHTNTYGDAIALGHASNWVVERCAFFGMRFHGVDVTGCKNITVRDCKYYGTVGSSYNGFQVDQAATNSIKGINADNTGSENVQFLNNYVTGASVDSLGPQSAAFHIHRSDNKNILIDGNFIENCDFFIQTDTGSTGNESIQVTNNRAKRGTIDGASATFLKIRGEIADLIVTGNRTYQYNIDVSIDHPTTGGFSTDIIVANNSFNYAINRSVYINQAYRANVHGNTIQGTSGDMVDAAIAFLGVNYFTCANNNIYDSDGDGIVVGSDAGGGISSNGLIHDNYILNGDTGLVCTAASTNNVLFYSNKTKGTFSTAETNINQNLTNVRDLGFYQQERTVSLAEAGRTINAGTTAQINMTITGAVQGDMVIVGYDKDLQGLMVYGNMYGYQAGRIYIHNPTAGNITIASGNWKVLAKSSRFIA